MDKWLNTESFSAWVEQSLFDYQEFVDTAADQLSHGIKHSAYSYQEAVDVFVSDAVGEPSRKIDIHDRAAFLISIPMGILACNPVGRTRIYQDNTPAIDGIRDDSSQAGGDGRFDVVPRDAQMESAEQYVNEIGACDIVDEETISSCIEKPEECNGMDDDCDGITDEDLLMLPCGCPGCEDDVQVCIDGAWTYCSCPPIPEEVCDGIDNDCDGKVDEDSNIEVTCGTNIGECKIGMQDRECKDGQLQPWSACEGGINPIEENCEGLDNDCDGEIDEDLTQQCLIACMQGLKYCVNGEWGECDAPYMEFEICDGLDNNCNGMVDEGDACCIPETEICDGIDNDCNGEVDECCGWEKIFEEDGKQWVYSILEDAKSNLVMAGWEETGDFSTRDALIQKIDSEGNPKWKMTYGGDDSDMLSQIREKADGNYIAAGRTKSYGAGKEDALVLETDEDGTLIWQNFYGGSEGDVARSICLTTDSPGYVFAGSTGSKGAGGSDLWVVRIDQQGETVWDKAFGGVEDDFAQSVCELENVGIGVAGSTKSQGAGGSDLWVLMLDHQGEEMWEHTFGEIDNDFANAIIPTKDGGLIVAGAMEYKGIQSYDARVIKFNHQGFVMWDNTYGGDAKNWAESIWQTGNSGYVVAGVTKSQGWGIGMGDMWVFRIGEQGDQLWEKPFGIDNLEHAFSVIETGDSWFAVTGSTRAGGVGDSDVKVLMLNQNGSPDCE